MNRLVGYARVSTKEQNLSRQIEALISYGVPEEKNNVKSVIDGTCVI